MNRKEEEGRSTTRKLSSLLVNTKGEKGSTIGSRKETENTKILR